MAEQLEFIDPSQIRLGPIRNESLPLELLLQINAVFDVVGPYIGKTLEQHEINLMRDSAPASEVVILQTIIAAWQVYHEKLLDGKMFPDAQEKKLLAALIFILTVVEDVAKLNVQVDVGRRLLKCYDELESV